MKRSWHMLGILLVMAFAFVACSTSSNTTSSNLTTVTNPVTTTTTTTTTLSIPSTTSEITTTVSSATTTVAPTTTLTTTTVTTLAPTTTQTTTSTPLVYNRVDVSGLTGEGTEESPYVVSAYVLETSSIPFELLPIGYGGTIEIYQGIKTSFGLFPLVTTSESDFDFTGSTDSLLVFNPSILGTLYIIILVDDTHATYIEVLVERKPVTVDFTTQLKVLAIGNSFSEDAMEYLYKIAQDAGITNVILGNLFIGGASLITHVTSVQNNSSNYIYYKNTADQWVARPNSSLMYGLLDEDWDIITIQQVSGSSGRVETYNFYLEDLIAIVQGNKTNPDARIVWNMTWAYQQNSTHGDFVHYNSNQITMYEAIVASVKSRITNHVSIQHVIPAGTAIQNLRTSYYGDTLTRDGYHLTNVVGRYTASLMWFASITGLDIQSIEYAPNGINAQDLLAIKEAVENALLHPYLVTPSTFIEKEVEEPEPTPVNPTIGVNLQPVYQLGFWNSNNSHLLIGGDPISKNFVSTVTRYSKADIPNGTIIIIEPGYQYRANFWTNLEGETLGRRTDNITNSMIVVDDAWWGTQQYVAFNLSVVGTPDITDRHPEVTSKFRIMLPFSTLQINFQSGFYNSTGSHNQITGDAISGNFISPDKRYSRTDIPVGTIITIQEGYQYRVNFWMNLDGAFTGNTRTANLTTSRVVVDDAWWGEQQYVSFNISQVGTPNIASQVELVASKFQVLLPNSRMVPLEFILGFYNSTGSHNIVTGDAISKNFVAVNQRFSKEELPIGSIIIIQPDYRYRVNFWKSLEGGFSGNVRSENLTIYLIVVDEAWWGEQSYVSFNVSPVSGGDLTDRVDEVSSKFIIIR
ncbi:MAG: DUF4886 domain-containing protein [Candidatus Izemoplasmatales bacterium]|nr:DUF4886 domain-containing protein [bacterium]MDZ4196172.1 DUF4886 domain-containing protein [Candidatus Izemoplasmatales bacterium]